MLELIPAVLLRLAAEGKREACRSGREELCGRWGCGTAATETGRAGDSRGERESAAPTGWEILSSSKKGLGRCSLKETKWN